MQTYNESFYDIISEGIGSLNNLQGFVDNVMAEKFNKLQIDGFRLEPMQADFDYAQIQKTMRINPMAIYSDLDSPVIPFGTTGFEVYGGKIPRMKTRRTMNEADVRKQRATAAQIGGSAAADAAREALFETLDTQIGAHTNSLTYQRNQMISKGMLSLTKDNNPYGISGVDFYSNVSNSNINKLAGSKRWWTDADRTTEGTDATPIEDLQAMVDTMIRKRGIRDSYFEIEFNTARDLVKHSKVVQAIAVNQYPLADAGQASYAASLLTWQNKLRILGEIVGAEFSVIDHLVSVETFDEASRSLVDKDFDAFEPNVLVLLPRGELGTVKTVVPYTMPLYMGAYANFYDGRLLITTDFDIQKKIQYIETEMTSLCVPNRPQLMYYIDVTGTANVKGFDDVQGAGRMMGVSGMSAPVEGGSATKTAKK